MRSFCTLSNYPPRLSKSSGYSPAPSPSTNPQSSTNRRHLCEGVLALLGQVLFRRGLRNWPAAELHARSTPRAATRRRLRLAPARRRPTPGPPLRAQVRPNSCAATLRFLKHVLHGRGAPRRTALCQSVYILRNLPRCLARVDPTFGLAAAGRVNARQHLGGCSLCCPRAACEPRWRRGLRCRCSPHLLGHPLRLPL